jgi:hypothetical protein
MDFYSHRTKLKRGTPDYGGIKFTPASSRNISRDDVFAYEMYRQQLFAEMDDMGEEFLFEEEWSSADCQPPKWKTRFYPTCNSIHEGDYIADMNSYPVG